MENNTKIKSFTDLQIWQEAHNSKFYILIFCLMFVGGIFALPKMTEAAITYDAGSNTITVVGDADCGDLESNPCTFEDIYQADQSNGWGKVSKPAEHTYIIDCFIVIGNGSTETYFADENKQVNFRAENFCTSNGQKILRATSHTHIRFGKVIDEDTKATGNGCQFIIQNDVSYWLNFLFSYGQVELYSTSVILTDRHDIMGGCLSTSYNSRIWNCIFENSYHFAFTRSTDIFNLTVINSSTFLRRPDATTVVNHCVGLSCSKGVWFQGAGGSVKDVYGRKISYAFYLTDLDENDTDCYIINGDFDSWKSRWKSVVPERKVFRQYTVNLKVVDRNGNPIEGANVVLKDKDGNVVFSETTNSEGKIPEQTVTYGYYQREGDGYYNHDDIFTSYSPHTLTISHQNYPSREFKFTLDKKIDWTIALKDKPTSVGSIKVWGTEYASDEAGTIYTQVFYGDGSPCNDIDPTDITATVYKSDGTKIIDGAQMTYVEGSNGIYKYDFPANTFSEEGVYIIDVKVDSTDPNITAYNSNEIHISKSANLISQNLDQKISEVASSVWSYTGRSLDNIDNIISGVWNAATSTMTVDGSIGKLIVGNLDDKISNVAFNVWSYTGSALSTAGNAISKVWSYTGNALDTAGNAIAKVWSYATRKLTSRQIGTDEYIAGVTSSSTVSQVADQPTQENVEYNVELVRKATFDFAGFADSGSTTTLVDSELEGPDNYWQYYKVIFMSGNNFGEERVITSYDADSHTLSWDPDNPLPHSVSANDKYVLSHEHRLVYKIWSYTDRSLTSVGNIASAVWGWTTRSLTTRKINENEYIAGVSSTSTVSQVASSKQVENIQSSINNLQTDITYIRNKVNDIYSDTQYIKDKIDNILTKWGSYSAQDIITDLDTIKSRIGTSTDISSNETLFGRTKYIQEKWGTQTAQTIYDKASSTLALVEDVQAEFGYNGTSTTAYADLQLIKSYVDDLEGYVGTPSDDSSAETLFGRIKGVKEGTDKLIENIIVAEASVNDSNASTTQFITNLTNSTDDFYNDNVLVFTSGNNAGQVRRITDYDGTLKKITVDPALAEAPANNDTFSILSQTAVAGIDAQTIWSYSTRTLTSPNLDSGSLATLSDLQKQWTVYLSDFGEVLAGNTYRAKLWVLNYESVPTDAHATPTLTIYDAVRNKVVENVEMTKISTGIYEYTYSVPSSAVQGVWETDVSVEVEAGKIIKRNDYWEVEGSPAQVKINSITDNTIPSISANVTISNEGSAGYEYQYEWCVVSSEDNPCGGGDDVFYSSAAKYIQAGEDWNTTLNATVSNTGSYWFKVVVYYGTEKSGASQTFTAVEEEEEEAPTPGGGGGVIVPEKKKEEEEKPPSTLGAVWDWIKKILKRLASTEKKTTTLTASVARLEIKLAELDKKMVKVLKPAPPQIIKERVVERRVVVRKPIPQVPRRRAKIRLEGR